MFGLYINVLVMKYSLCITVSASFTVIFFSIDEGGVVYVPEHIT